MSLSLPDSSLGSEPLDDALAAELERLIAERRPADALDLLDPMGGFRKIDTLERPFLAPWLVQIWIQVGSYRGLRAIEAPLPPELAEARQRFLADGPTPVPIPRGTLAEVRAIATDAGVRGLVRELAHAHLGLAEFDLRVDERLAHIECAEALAAELEDSALRSLALAYRARLDLHLGELDDARDEAEDARELGLAHAEPRAAVIGIAVLAALDNDRVALAEAHTRLAQLGFAPDAFGLSPAGPPQEGV